MNVMVLGASGVIGQHMRLTIPNDESLEVRWYRSRADVLHHGINLKDSDGFEALAQEIVDFGPDVIVNLAGESRVDVVEQNPDAYFIINVRLPAFLSEYCFKRRIHYIHVSSQAVFKGDNPPYKSDSQKGSVNAYGAQKINADQVIEQRSDYWSIIRPSFVLGVRPMPAIGRTNPIEGMLDGSQEFQENDREFSPAFAINVAAAIWQTAYGSPLRKALHVAIPMSATRYALATYLKPFPQSNFKPVSHDQYMQSPGCAQRPLNTAFVGENECTSITAPLHDLDEGLRVCKYAFKSRMEIDTLQRAKEISIFLGHGSSETFHRMSQGFLNLHADVTKDFNRHMNGSTDEKRLLEWYRQTEAYIWELSAYHCDPGFNYMGMCQGIAERLVAELPSGSRVLSLGDGIGDLSILLHHVGFNSFYHDLRFSTTACFAQARQLMYLGALLPELMTSSFNPREIIDVQSEKYSVGQFDAIVSLDFLEHVPNVEEWLKTVGMCLKTGALFCAQNAFGMGSGPDGSMPMHLACNDRFEKDYDPLMEKLGFQQLSSNWYKKIAETRTI